MIEVPRALFVFTVSVALVACANSDFRGESQAPQYPPYKGEVALLEKFPSPGSFERLGVITVKSHGISYDTTLADKISKDAAARGANAVVLQGKVRSRRDGDGHEVNVLAGWAIRLNSLGLRP